MNTKARNIALVLAALFATNSLAASLDFREEYKHDSEEWAGRVKLGGGVGNHFFGVEMKHKGDLNDLQGGDNEFEYGYKWKLSDKWLLTTSMPITFSDNYVTWKPQARIQYTFDSGLKAKFRYRHEIRNYKHGEDTTGRDGEKHEHLNKSKLTANLDYNWKDWQFGFEANYAEDFFDNEWAMGPSSDKDHEWDMNMKIGYRMDGSNWRPYVEFGNVQCTSSSVCSHTRQVRSRAGITYYF